MKLPACTPCGLSVDWSSRCYSSEWHLFAAPNESVTTPGRYYFSPSFTPFVSGYHFYGSRDWYDRNWRLEQSLGESLTVKRSFDPGTLPATFPQRIAVGDPGCLSRGEDFANKLPYNQIYDGFSTACFLPEQLAEDTWPLVSSIDSCSLQFFYATILAWMYHRDWHSIEVAFDLLIPDCVVHHQVGNEYYPSLVVVVTDQWCVLVSDGTQTYQQWAMQALYGISAPEEFGLFGTLRLWYEASTVAVDFLNDCGANPFGKFMICGHSYGGANASLLAARIIAAGPLREVALLTFGCPKPGDIRVRRLLHNVRSLHLSNRQDIVCSVAPDLAILWPIVEFTGLFEVEVWSMWEGVAGRALMDADGSIVMNLEPVLDSNTLLTMLNQILNSEPIFDIVTHPVSVYRSRILRRCPEREWPIDLPLFNWLKTYDLAALTEIQIGPITVKYPQAGLVVSGQRYADAGLVVDGDNPFSDAASTGLLVGGDGGGDIFPSAGLVVGPEEELLTDLVIGGEENLSTYAGLVVGPDVGELTDAGLVVGAEEGQVTELIIGPDVGKLPDVGIFVGPDATETAPGISCAVSTVILGHRSYTWTTSTTDDQWWTLGSLAFPSLFWMKIASSGDFVGAETYFGTDCTFQFFMETLTLASPCATHLFFHGEQLWFRVLPTATPVVYVISTDDGSC